MTSLPSEMMTDYINMKSRSSEAQASIFSATHRTTQMPYRYNECDRISATATVKTRTLILILWWHFPSKTRKHQKQLFERPFKTMPFLTFAHRVEDESFLAFKRAQESQNSVAAWLFLLETVCTLVDNLKDHIQTLTISSPRTAALVLSKWYLNRKYC